MAWVIVVFSDLTVSIVPKKWLTKRGKVKMCYFPKTGAAAKIKAAVDVDKKSKQWGIYSYRLLMDGEEYDTYAEAKKAEIIAQNHSTMKSFEAFEAEKVKIRKRPVVHFDTSSSSSESESQDFKNIDKLTKLDAKLVVDKEYTYDSGADKNENCLLPSNNRSENDNSQSSDDGTIESDGEDKDDCLNEDDNQIVNEFEIDGSTNEDEDPSSDDESNNHTIRVNGNSALNDNGITSYLPLESTSEERQVNISDLNSGYNDFSDGRCLTRIEKAVMFACQLLKESKTTLKEIKANSKETKSLVQGLVPSVKDLAIEVFDSKEEIKKRNGLFTDLLAPEIGLTIREMEEYLNVEKALKKNKNVDNLTKYLASTINEPDEKCFVKACINVIFGKKFFMKKVWWKKDEGKADFKHSQILHCMRESFKLKFGLTEPNNSEKVINKLIHKVCVNIKDTERKKKKARKAAKLAAKLGQAADAEETTEKCETGQIGEGEQNFTKKAKKTKKSNKRLAEDDVTASEEEEEVKPNGGAKVKKAPKKRSTAELDPTEGGVKQDDESEPNLKKKPKKTTKKAAKGPTDEVVRNETDMKIGNEQDGHIKSDENEEQAKKDKKAAKKAAKRATTKLDLNEGEDEANQKFKVTQCDESEGNSKKKTKKAAKRAAEKAETNAMNMKIGVEQEEHIESGQNGEKMDGNSKTKKAVKRAKRVEEEAKR